MTRQWVLNFVSRAGTPSDVDVSTNNLSQCMFARACIEIDLSYPLVSGTPVEVEGEEEFWQQHVYDKIGVYCFQCGRIGHRHSECVFLVAGQNEIVQIDGIIGEPIPQLGRCALH